MSMLIASYGVVLVGSYLVGFILLVIVYWKILKLIQKMKQSLGESRALVGACLQIRLLLSCLHAVERTGVNKTYGVTSNVIVQGQSQAKQRVVYFLTVFLISGFFSEQKSNVVVLNIILLSPCIDLFLSFAHVVYESSRLRQLPAALDRESIMPNYVFLIYIGQVSVSLLKH